MDKNEYLSRRKDVFECAVIGNYTDATNNILEMLKGFGVQERDCGNLAYLAFNFCNMDEQASIFRRLLDMGIENEESLDSKFLLASFAIAMDDEKAGEYVGRYLAEILRPNVSARPTRPIVYWHIPKCSGTSINAGFSSIFYTRPITELLPAYSYKPLLTHLAKYHLDEIPYLPSAHLSQHDLKIGSDAFSFTVLRDPVKRAASMFRQQYHALSRTGRSPSDAGWYHYLTLPRYGSFWDYRKDKSIKAWMNNVPRDLLQQQLTTFSERGSRKEAAEAIRSLDYFFIREIGFGSEQALFSCLGLPYRDGVIPNDLGKTNESITITDEEHSDLREILGDEYAMLSEIAGAKAGYDACK